ncbi:hypothetical protein EST38_g12783 [Candolleomyces aberdarensis]|uniref:SHSP domain-containing protein n=1 Tax=Candolleomyces aberdarensis TaxID=2316362 RepID=A0A4Q2D3U8_9AGAR|nr:hypothetical protein EST38_g12783 [Candolleomyces aberdarensis]
MRFTPRMDLVDDPITNTRIAIFELPGIKTADVTLQIQRGNLVITGERRPPPAVQKALEAARTSLARNPVAAANSIAAGDMADDSECLSNPSPNPSLAFHELRFGQFGRAIPVPEGIKESDVTAALQDGMLTVTWPKNPAARSVQSATPPVSPITGTAAQ